MGLRNQSRKQKVGNDILAFDEQIDSTLARLDGLVANITALNNKVQARAFFTNDEKAEVSGVLDEILTRLWENTYDRIPQYIRDSYPA